MKLCNIIKMNQDLSVFFQEIGVLLSSIKDGGVGGILLNWMNMKILVLIASNIYHVQATNSVCGYFCILLNLCLRVKHYMII